jgi:hypothetical protein
VVLLLLLLLLLMDWHHCCLRAYLWCYLAASRGSGSS